MKKKLKGSTYGNKPNWKTQAKRDYFFADLLSIYCLPASSPAEDMKRIDGCKGACQHSRSVWLRGVAGTAAVGSYAWARERVEWEGGKMNSSHTRRNNMTYP